MGPLADSLRASVRRPVGSQEALNQRPVPCARRSDAPSATVAKVLRAEVRPAERKLPKLRGHVAPSVFRHPAKLLRGVRPSRAGARSTRAAGTRQLGGTVRLGVCLIRVPFSRVSGTLTERRQNGTPGHRVTPDAHGRGAAPGWGGFSKLPADVCSACNPADMTSHGSRRPIWVEMAASA